MHNTLEPVPPTAPVAPWLGGKRNLAKRGCEDDYGKAMFSRADFGRLADMIRRIKGRVLMSINDVPEIREAFAGLHVAEVRTSYSISTRNDAAGARAELLISNWPLDSVKTARR